MEFPLEYRQPPPAEMPETVTLETVLLDPNEPRSWHYCLSGAGHKWAFAMNRSSLSWLLDWLYRNGYAPVPGSEPPQFKRA
jgi:hypothetical protein